MCGGGRTTQPPKPIFIDNQEVEIVKSFDPTHLLNYAFQKLPSGRRLKYPLANKNVLKKKLYPLPF